MIPIRCLHVVVDLLKFRQVQVPFMCVFWSSCSVSAFRVVQYLPPLLCFHLLSEALPRAASHLLEGKRSSVSDELDCIAANSLVAAALPFSYRLEQEMPQYGLN